MPDKTYLRAKQSFGVQYNGEFITVAAGEYIPENHPLLKQIGKDAVAEHFEEVTSFGRWDTETADAKPGTRRGETRSATRSVKKET